MDNLQDPEHLLAHHKVRKTPFRTEVLGYFLESNRAVSAQEIRGRMTASKDRVTLYRTLETFLEKGIIHKVLDANNGVKYALHDPSSAGHDHDHEHVHFICDTCKETFCLDEVKVPRVQLPNGFKAAKANLTVTGLCDQCESEA